MLHCKSVFPQSKFLSANKQFVGSRATRYFGNIDKINIALGKSQNLWKHDFWYTLILDWYKFRAHNAIFTALSTIVWENLGT